MSYARLGQFPVYVVQYTTAIQSRLDSAQTLVTYRHTPKKIFQPGLNVLIQCRSTSQHESLVRYLREHQLSMIHDGEIFPLRFEYPAARLDYLVYIPRIKAGLVRFNYAPTLALQMLTVKDLIHTPTKISSLGEPWEGVYKGEIEDKEESGDFTPPAEGPSEGGVAPGLGIDTPPSTPNTGVAPGLGINTPPSTPSGG